MKSLYTVRLTTVDDDGNATNTNSFGLYHRRGAIAAGEAISAAVPTLQVEVEDSKHVVVWATYEIEKPVTGVAKTLAAMSDEELAALGLSRTVAEEAEVAEAESGEEALVEAEA